MSSWCSNSQLITLRDPRKGGRTPSRPVGCPSGDSPFRTRHMIAVRVARVNPAGLPNRPSWLARRRGRPGWPGRGCARPRTCRPWSGNRRRHCRSSLPWRCGTWGSRLVVSTTCLQVAIKASLGFIPRRRFSTTRKEAQFNRLSSPSPTEPQEPTVLSRKSPAPRIGESPTRPGTL